ncbi:Hypothetical protein HVPorG_02181 (plasmid) [Roseomonas mucosa]|uniref:hypothetical protein n=1 Tax=Roseomonas mucosa TaxID=207340 RepID=UPI00220816EB|nr:hypothetical protein [Roseomonas mucosa]QDJ12261.1 Hypothetical protein HVPorG_02181 [Roseomonas mucosa]
MADYYTVFSCYLPLGGPGRIEPALAIFRAMQAEKDRQGETLGFDADHHPHPSADGLFLGADTTGEPEHVIEFALRCAEAFDLQGPWGFRWALTCSRGRLDGYGGGAHLLDLGRRETIAWVDVEDWLQGQIAAAAEGRAAAA